MLAANEVAEEANNATNSVNAQDFTLLKTNFGLGGAPPIRLALPSTPTRSQREGAGSRPQGRTQEIQRLIGRSLRAIVDLEMLGERTITLDCDVIEADGGTRTASITGAVVALGLAIEKLHTKGIIKRGQRP